VWRPQVGAPKNLSSENIIPALPLVKEMLEKRREHLMQAKKGVPPCPEHCIFAGTHRGAPLCFRKLQYRIIKPALADSGVNWHSFHRFRRGLATNLLELGVNPVVIARILRRNHDAGVLRQESRCRVEDGDGQT
jgi:site-specific recombinase XerD